MNLGLKLSLGSGQPRPLAERPFFNGINFSGLTFTGGITGVLDKDGDFRTVAVDTPAASGLRWSLTDSALSAYNPFLAVTGDSIVSYNTAAPFTPYYDGGPSGDPEAQIMAFISGLTSYENHANGGETFAWVAATGAVSAVAAGAKAILIHCGSNDISTARTWAAVEANLDTIAALLGAGQTLFIDEIIPRSGFNDTQAGTVRTWNANLATWCTANDAVLILSHDTLGQLRVSTGALDDLADDYDQGDGIHLTTAGAEVLAAAWGAALLTAYGGFDQDTTYPSTKATVQGRRQDLFTDTDPTSFKRFLRHGQRINSFLNSTAPVTQNITTTAQSYAVSVVGTGSVTLSGTATGTATDGSPLTVTATAGTLTVTVAGSPTHVQVEAGAYATAPIPTSGTAVTRPRQKLSGPSAGVLRPNNIGFLLQVIPSSPAANATWTTIISSTISASTYFSLSLGATGAAPTMVRTGNPHTVAPSYTPTAGVPMQIQAYVSTAYGAGVRSRYWAGSAWSAWSAWGTQASTADIIVQPTVEYGHFLDYDQYSFNGHIQMVRTFWTMDPKGYLEALA
jgi:lysophospholipase L1-like esterase